MVVGNHFATLPTYVVPSFCACLQPVVSLGPPEGATTHNVGFPVFMAVLPPSPSVFRSGTNFFPHLILIPALVCLMLYNAVQCCIQYNAV